MGYFHNKTFLLTGAYGGFGAYFTRYLLERGAKLVLTDYKLPAQKTTNDPNILLEMEADLSLESGADSIFQRTQAEKITVDGIIHNAGIASIGKFPDTPKKDGDKILQVNLLAPIHLNRLFLPGMVERKSGHLVHISSVAGFMSPAGLSYYSISKFGISTMGHCLYSEYKDQGIFVTNCYPFFTKTNILESSRFGGISTQLPDFLVEDPAKVVLELVDGIQDRQTEVYPGITSKSLNILKRMFPSISQFFSKLT